MQRRTALMQDGDSHSETRTGGVGGGGEEVDEVAVRVTEEQGAVAPRHPGGLVDELGDDLTQTRIDRINVTNEEVEASPTRKSRLTERLARGSAAPSPSSGTVRVLAIARVPSFVCSSANSGWSRLAVR